jgi:hypothetical protein
MCWIRSVALASFFALMATGDSARAVTKLHDPDILHKTVIHGVTNGSGINRGPWVVQIQIAKDNVGANLLLTAIVDDGTDKVAPTLVVIAGDGTIFRGVPSAENRSSGICLRPPVTGWMTVHIDIPGPSERRFQFEFTRNFCFE